MMQQQQHQVNAGQQHGLPQLQQHPHHSRSGGLLQQQQQQQHQHRPISPQQSQHFQSSLHSSYASPHSSTHPLPQQHQQQSPYVGSLPVSSSQHPNEPTFFPTHPSSYTTHGSAGSFAPSEPADSMATQAAMSRPHFPPISSYQTPQSNSPASIHSPQTDPHGRQLYGMAPMPQQLYYPQYQMPQQSPYGQHPGPSHQSSVTSAPGLLLSHQPPAPQQMTPPQPQQSHHQHHGPSSQSAHPHPSMLDTKPPVPTLPRQPSSLALPQGSPQTPSGPSLQGTPTATSRPNSSAAPGPIPATTPLVVRQDHNGVQWIAFEYSRDRVKMEYTIRCDVESVNVDELDQDFKTANCVYPRACCGKEQYKGNRLHYESECNAVGWALAQLNPNLREKRGLIQRAVDSWRNSNQDVRLRSRRVRRMAKIHNRNTAKTQGATSQYAGLPGQGAVGLQPPPHSMSSGNVRPPNLGSGAPQMQHHHHHSDPNDASGGGDVSVVGNGYALQHSGQLSSSSTSSDLTASPASVRNAHNFYASYPPQPSVGGSSMPSIRDSMDSLHGHTSSTLATPASRSEDHKHKHSLFGDVPEAKRRKFILVDDVQRGGRVRVRVMLDQVNMDDMPDAHLRINAVYPRSYYARQMRSPLGTPHGSGTWDDEDDESEPLAAAPIREVQRTMVSLPLVDGSGVKLPIPRMKKSRRSREIALNELGYRMSWGQARTFNGRTLFLQRALDAYRNKQRSTMISAGTDVATISPHFETRPGKRKWLDRCRDRRRAGSV